MGIGRKVDEGAVSVYQTKNWVVVYSIFENSGDSGRSRSRCRCRSNLSKVGRTRVESVKYKELFVGIGCKADAGAVSVYQTKHGSLSPQFSKTWVIRVGLALGVGRFVEGGSHES